MTYLLTDFDLERLVSPLATATASLARLDERIARSAIREGWTQRMHFRDAIACQWLDGELVHLEDLVLHDARMDIRAPTHELIRTHDMLRTRRQMAGQEASWALSAAGLAQLRGRAPDRVQAFAALERKSMDSGDALEAEMNALDAVLARAQQTLDAVTKTQAAPATREVEHSLIYDADWDEDERLRQWLGVVEASAHLPPVLRTALALEAWHAIGVLQHTRWLGPLLAASLLRETGLTAAHLVALHIGLQAVPREERQAKSRNARLCATLNALTAASQAGLKEHDRLLLAKGHLERRVAGRRSSSRLPDLIKLVLSHPVVSSGMIEAHLGVSAQGAVNLVTELGLREVTGRQRFRAWGLG